MKSFGILILFILTAFSTKNATTNTLSVLDFGATGNGTTDDTQAINSCFASAHSTGKNVYFPDGTYLCNKTDGSGHILVYDVSGLNNTTVYGDTASIIKTTKDSASTQLFVTAFSRSVGFIIGKLIFINTHHKIVGQTPAIFETGGINQLLDTTSILSCKFDGQSTAIAGIGITGWAIKNDSFFATNGHDAAEQNSDPAVNIWAFDNGGGLVQNTDIEDCYGEGYTGTFPMACKRPMDGMVYGVYYGLTVQGCKERRYSEELLSVSPPSSAPTTTATIVIANNSLDCTLPPGCVNDDNSPHKQNYGIRVDANHTTIKGNKIKNYTNGIMVRGIDFPSFTQKDFTIVANILQAPLATDTTYSIQKSIFIQGNAGLTQGVTVQNNTHQGVDADPVQILSVSGLIRFGETITPINIFKL